MPLVQPRWRAWQDHEKRFDNECCQCHQHGAQSRAE
ncbi:hypothetical protein MGSAQ_002375 [marine sediment metagenome]|uniref:Uncharacterized protein n=1 Tax=marine sediment metagenome TaxID=412755 RepID=A0A1B6NRQ1_9ZZZZ